MENHEKLNNTSGNVALPFNEEQFKSFIVSLLGKPQSISKRFEGNFEIAKEDIVALHTIIDQRITQQNDSQLIQFRATVYYDDNSTVTLNGYDHLVNYSESLPVVSKAIHLTWQYLIKFRDKETFEKQEINLSFITETDYPLNIDKDENYYVHGDYASIRINHTARTWGADIEAIISKHMATLVKKESRFNKYFRYNDETVKNGIQGLLALTTLSFTIYNTLKLKADTSLTLNTIFWIHYYSGIIFLFIALYIFSKVIEIILEDLRIPRKPSFILLTSESYKDKEKTLKSYKRNWQKYTWTIISSVLLGVVGNYVYAYLTT